MLDGYGIQSESLELQTERLRLARDGYEASCLRLGTHSDWDGLESDERHLWFMSAEAMMRYRRERDFAIAS